MADLFLTIPISSNSNTTTVAKNLTEENSIFMEGDRISLKVDLFDQTKDLPINNFTLSANLLDGDRTVIGKFVTTKIIDDANAVAILADYKDTSDYVTLTTGEYGNIFESTNYFIIVSAINTVDSYKVTFLPIQIYIKRTKQNSDFLDGIINTEIELPEAPAGMSYITGSDGYILTGIDGKILYGTT